MEPGDEARPIVQVLINVRPNVTINKGFTLGQGARETLPPERFEKHYSKRKIPATLFLPS